MFESMKIFQIKTNPGVVNKMRKGSTCAWIDGSVLVNKEIFLSIEDLHSILRYMTGGIDNDYNEVSSLEKYDVSTNGNHVIISKRYFVNLVDWKALAPMSRTRWRASSANMNGKMYGTCERSSNHDL